MNRHAKASSAASTERQATGLGRIVRGAFAGRGASSDADGSGAPSYRGKLSVLAAGAATLSLLVFLVASAYATKEAINYFGTQSGSGTLGGQLNNPRDIGVNRTGAGGVAAGTIYVADDNNNRVQRFSPAGAFVSAWGADVIQSGKAGDVVGTNPFEICTAAEDCKAGVATGGNGATSGNGAMDNPQSVAVDGDTGNVYVSDRDNRRVNEYSATGTFIRSFGFDVDATEAATTYEVCPAANVCKIGVAGAGVGQVGSTGTAGTLGIAVSQPNGEAAVGSVFLADSQNRRVNTYALDGTSPSSFGSSANFGTVNPRKIAVDSRGIVYASDSSNSNEIDRYDTEDANGGGIGFIASIATPPLLAGPASTATSGLAVDPDSDGGGSDEDVLYVLRDPSSGNTVVQQYGPTNDPGLTAAPTAVDDTHGNGAGFTTVQGLGLNDATGTLYVSATNSVGGTGSGHRVYVLTDPITAPVPVMNAISVKGEETATLSGTVDPTGGFVTCRFEYATEPSFAGATVVNEPDCAALAVGGGAQAVTENVTGLLPNTTYYVRLAVIRPFIASSTVNSTLKSFATDSVPPVVSNVGAVQVQDTSARLVGTVDPRNSATGYVFEYGTTPAMGSSTAPLNIGGGTTPITVSQVVTGLAKDTDYYLRLVATNAFGSTPSKQATLHTRSIPFPPANEGPCPNEAVREEQNTTHLPDCRAYEMVSPIDKNQGGTDQNFWKRNVSNYARDGEAAAFCTNALFGEPPGENSVLCAQYVSRRTGEAPTGWATSDPFPRYCHNDRDEALNQYANNTLSPNMNYALNSFFESSACPIPLVDPGAPDRAINIYKQDMTAEPYSWDLLAPTPTDAQGNNGGVPLGFTDDFSHVVYLSIANQTLDSPAPGSFYKIYDWEEEGHGACVEPGGCLRLVSKNPANEPFTTSSQYSEGGGEAPQHDPNPSAVSDDGSHIFFRNGSSPQKIYVRVGNAVTYDVSESECTLSGACGSPRTSTFHWADPSGEIALISSCARLTDASTECTEGGGSLYRWEEAAPPGHHLTDLTVDQEPSDGSSAGVLGIMGASDDGDVVYAIATNQIVAGAPTHSNKKLYRIEWNEGAPTVEYLGPYSSLAENGNVTANSLSRDPNADNWHDRVTPDGKYIMVTSLLRLDPVSDQDDTSDAYRWDEGNGWICVSCQLPGEMPPGPPAAGHVNSIAPDSQKFEELKSFEPRVEISDDGQRIVFSAQDPLVPEDVNGETGCEEAKEANAFGHAYFCQDIYEWHDGRISLLTSGAGPNYFVLMGMTHDGKSVFFQTKEHMVGWDTDTGTDIYVARRDGGFPEPPPAPPACEGEACRGAGSSQPTGAGAGTAAFQGPGDPIAKRPKPRKCPKGKRKARRKGKVRCVKRRRAHRRHTRKRIHNRTANYDRRTNR